MQQQNKDGVINQSSIILALTSIESATGSLVTEGKGAPYGKLVLNTGVGPLDLTLGQFDEIYKGFVRCWPGVKPLKDSLNAHIRDSEKAEKEKAKQAVIEEKAKAKATREAEMQAKKEQAEKDKATRKAEMEAKAKARKEQEAKAKADREAKAKATQEIKEKAEKEKAEKQAKEQAAKVKAEKDAAKGKTYTKK